MNYLDYAACSARTFTKFYRFVNSETIFPIDSWNILRYKDARVVCVERGRRTYGDVLCLDNSKEGKDSK